MKLVKKLILSALSLVFVGVTLVSTTFAWFKINSRAEISNFNFTATGGLGFMISHDGVHFQNDLTTDQMTSAIILGYDGGFTYGWNKDGKLARKINGSVSDEAELTPTEKSAILDDKILLMPVTSQYGYSFQTVSNSSAGGANTGQFIEFDLYFKATSDLEKDNLAYDISLYLAKNNYTNEQKKLINPTSIESDTDVVTLRKNMKFMTLDENENWINHDELNTNYEGKSITVASMNALRFSTEKIVYKEIKVYMKDDGKKLYPDENGKYYDGEQEVDVTNLDFVTEKVVDDQEDVRKQNSNIYEFYDERDHGSYAVKDEPLNTMYNPDYNAMLTYYNNQKATKIKPIEKEVLPKTFRYRVGTDLTNEQIDNLPTVATVNSGSETQRVTFRFWLEGWDADCFDGLAKSINVNLTFKSQKVNS